MSTRHKRQSRRSNLSYFVIGVGATKLRMIINSASIRIPARVSIRAVVRGHTAQQRYLADASCRTCEPLFYPERNWVNGLSKEKEKEREREKERNNGIRLLLLPSLYSRNWNIHARFAALAYGYADYRHRFTGAVTDQRLLSDSRSETGRIRVTVNIWPRYLSNTRNRKLRRSQWRLLRTIAFEKMKNDVVWIATREKRPIGVAI